MKRRDFIKKGISSTIGFGVGLTVLNDAASVRSVEANNRINLASIGCGGRGRQLLMGFDYADGRIPGFKDCKDVHVSYCCDPRGDRGEKVAEQAGAKYVSDMRTVFDDPKVDAVVSALPDHWHALASIWACQAGKDVFTEKPASHSGWEGRKMVEAARKYKRIVQHGTQNRSAPYNVAAKKYIEDGKLGTIHLCRVFNQKQGSRNVNIKPGEPVPEGLDWNGWLGPAAERTYSSTYLSHWHDFWNFSSGDLVNDGVHQVDLARWLIGKELPKSAYAVGGRFAEQNDSETPDTLVAVFEYDDLTMTVGETLFTPYMLKIDAVVRQSDMFPLWMQCATRIEIYGTKGMMMVGRHGGGWEVYVRPKSRQPVVEAFAHGRFPDQEHKENFLRCIRSRELPNADIEEGHKSTLLIHYSTISYRLGGRKLLIDRENGTIKDEPEAQRYWKREYRAPFVVPEEV